MDVLAPLAILALVGVIIAFVFGIGSMAFGHETSEDMVVSNKLMRLRVGIQALALGLIITGLLIAKYWYV